MKPLMSETRTAVIGALIVALGSVSMALYTPAMPTLVEVLPYNRGGRMSSREQCARPLPNEVQQGAES